MRWRVKDGMYRTVSLSIALLLVRGAVAAEHVLVPGAPFDAVASRLVPGDTLVVRPGVYREGWTIGGMLGTAEQPITIRGEAGAILRPARERDGIVFWGGGGSQHVVIKGFVIEGARRAGIVVSGSHHITIRDCTIRSNRVWGVQTSLSDHVTVEDCELAYSAEEHGVYFSTTDHPVVTDCHIHHNAGCGVHMNGDVNEGGDGVISGGRVVGNRIHHNGRLGGAAVNMDGVEQTVVEGNIIYANTAGGIVSFVQNGAHAGHGNIFRHNTVSFERGVGRFALSLVGGSQDATVEGNILVCGRGPAFLMDGPSLAGLKSRDNVFWRVGPGPAFAIGEERLALSDWVVRTKQDRSSVFADPLFVDQENGDLSLRTGSPASMRRAGAIRE